MSTNNKERIYFWESIIHLTNCYFNQNTQNSFKIYINTYFLLLTFSTRKPVSDENSQCGICTWRYIWHDIFHITQLIWGNGRKREGSRTKHKEMRENCGKVSNLNPGRDFGLPINQQVAECDMARQARLAPYESTALWVIYFVYYILLFHVSMELRWGFSSHAKLLSNPQSHWTSKAEIAQSPIKNGSRRIVKDGK